MEIFEFGELLRTFVNQRTSLVLVDVIVHHPVETVSVFEINVPANNRHIKRLKPNLNLLVNLPCRKQD
jgi:hypothetical protein